jgi:lysophospholipase L1-like esterase
MVRLLTISTLALALLVAPLFGGNDKNFTYLALGDSIAFGFNPTLFPPFKPPMPVPTPNQFVGYPDSVADTLHLLQSKKEVNAACPGETSGSFLNGNTPDNGCNGAHGFKATIGLHTNYDGSQESFAVSELASNKHINLVTLSIGGNDLLLLQQFCAIVPSMFAECVMNNLPSVLTTYAKNLTVILGNIRATYHGTLIVMNSYSPSSDLLFIEAISELNQMTMEVGSNFGVKFADAFTAFLNYSELHGGGDPCAAGLLISLSPAAPGCDVHPSPLGRDLLAQTVLSVL